MAQISVLFILFSNNEYLFVCVSFAFCRTPFSLPSGGEEGLYSLSNRRDHQPNLGMPYAGIHKLKISRNYTRQSNAKLKRGSIQGWRSLLLLSKLSSGIWQRIKLV